MGFALKCPDCRKKFPWDKETRFPRFCPLCKSDLGDDRADDDIPMPMILHSKSKTFDKVYRDMEKGSEFRAQAAAELAGCSASEMSNLKITNMKDNVREGESSDVAINNPVTQFMAANPNSAGFRGADGLGYSTGTQAGPFPNAGAKMRTSLQQHHAALSHGSAVSDRPALETIQPGYRQRG